MKQKKWLVIAVIALCAAAIIAAVVLICGKDKAEEGSTEVDASANGISVLSMSSVDGAFIEDGSDENAEGVFCVVFANDSDMCLQYAKLTLTVGKEDYHFELTTIPAGAQVQAFELDRKTMPDTSKDCSLVAENISWFTEDPSLYEDMLKITTQNNAIIIENISGETIGAPIYVYYKNFYENTYIGGITYRTGTQVDLEPGQSVALNAGHYYTESSQLMFVTYVP